MPVPSDPYRFEFRDGVYLVHLNSAIEDPATVGRLKESLSGLIDGVESPLFVLDFEGVKHYSSLIFGAIMSFHMRIRRREGRMRLCNVPPMIRDLFHLIKLEQILDIDDTIEDAMKSIQDT